MFILACCKAKQRDPLALKRGSMDAECSQAMKINLHRCHCRESVMTFPHIIGSLIVLKRVATQDLLVLKVHYRAQLNCLLQCFKEKPNSPFP